jgi:hypothetical protein
MDMIFWLGNLMLLVGHSLLTNMRPSHLKNPSQLIVPHLYDSFVMSSMVVIRIYRRWLATSFQFQPCLLNLNEYFLVHVAPYHGIACCLELQQLRRGSVARPRSDPVPDCSLFWRPWKSLDRMVRHFWTVVRTVKPRSGPKNMVQSQAWEWRPIKKTELYSLALWDRSPVQS